MFIDSVRNPFNLWVACASNPSRISRVTRLHNKFQAKLNYTVRPSLKIEKKMI